MMMMMMMMMMMNCLWGMAVRRKAFTPHFQPALSEILTILNLGHSASSVWICIESEFIFVEWSCAVLITATPLQFFANSNFYHINATNLLFSNIVEIYDAKKMYKDFWFWSYSLRFLNFGKGEIWAFWSQNNNLLLWKCCWCYIQDFYIEHNYFNVYHFVKILSSNKSSFLIIYWRNFDTFWVPDPFFCVEKWKQHKR